MLPEPLMVASNSPVTLTNAFPELSIVTSATTDSMPLPS